jgi:dUTPase
MTNLSYNRDHFYGKEVLIPGEPIQIKKGQKIAQGIIHPFGKIYRIQQVLHISTETCRGEGGFGSSGK